MDVHQHAKSTPKGRLLMVRRLADGWSVAKVAAGFGVTARTVRKWRARHATEGEAGLRDRSSRPLISPTRLDQVAEAEILALRRQRLTGPAIARRLGRPVATVGLVLRRHGLGRLAALKAKPEIVRYQRERPGELIHLDIKKLGRIDGVGHRPRRGRYVSAGTGACRRQRRSPATAAAGRAASAGTFCTSRSTTPPGSPTARSCPTSARKVPWRSSAAHWLGSRASASPSSG
jgi:hypothetical protein